jgi:hypothetical protein
MDRVGRSGASWCPCFTLTCLRERGRHEHSSSIGFQKGYLIDDGHAQWWWLNRTRNRAREAVRLSFARDVSVAVSSRAFARSGTGMKGGWRVIAGSAVIDA